MEEGEQGALVVRLEGLAPQQGKPADVGPVQGLQKRLLGLGGKGLAVAEVPGLGLEAALAAVGAKRVTRTPVPLAMSQGLMLP